MRTLAAIAFSCLALCGLAQENKTWRLGAEFGSLSNSSGFAGGMSTANGRFQHDNFDGGSLSLQGRYDFNPRWAFTTGFGFNSTGYRFSLSENYSFFNMNARYSTLRSEFGSVSIPWILHYKFRLNCRNQRWLLGGGFNFDLTGDKQVNQSYVEDTEGNSNQNYLRVEARSRGGAYVGLRFVLGRERIFKRGGILNLSLLLNAGLNELSRAKVTYTADGQVYSHEFSNKGNFVGVRVSWFFRPVNKSVNN